MLQKSYIKTHWKLLLNIVTLIALVALVYATRHQLSQVLDNLAQVHAWALLLMIPIEIFNYHAQTKVYQGLFATLGNKIDYRPMYEKALELNFVNNVFPSGGVSGISYFGARMRSGDITAGKATLVQLMKLVLVFVSFEVMLLLGLLLLAIGGHVNNLTILVAASLSTLLVVGTLGFAFIIGSRQRISTFSNFLTKSVSRVTHIFRPHYHESIDFTRVERLFTDLHENYIIFKVHYRELKKPLAYALLANLTEVTAIYVVYIAFGHWVNPGAIIIAYAVANFAGLVSVLPGGVGVYEGLMIAVLKAAGVPGGLSIAVTVMYRVVNMLIQLPAGYYFYHQTLRRKSQPTVDA